MKKVAILTRHNVPNYGAVLQAYALQEALRRIGCDAVVVDYLRSQEEFRNVVGRLCEGGSLLGKAYHRTIWAASARLVSAHFERERSRILSLSDRCDERDVWDKLPDVDVCLVGSDQIWRRLSWGEVDDVYFCNGLDREGVRIVSYAASFGGGSIAPGYDQRISKWLSRFDAISVREDSGVDLVEQCGGRATQVLDPALLLTAEDWRRFAREGFSRSHSKPYALVYNLHRDPDMLSRIRRSEEGSGLRVVSLCPSFRPRIGKHAFLPALAEFVALFDGASRVYTDSFHGVAFSASLGAPFVAFSPAENSERIRSLLRLLGLEQRLWDGSEDGMWDNGIDWKAVGEKIEAERSRSLDWLASAVGGG